MADYKDTLNLPHTLFPMKAGLSQREPQMLQVWAEKKIYKTLRHLRKDSSCFVLHDGPPYANGHLHCGHALNKILKDIVVKSKSLSGFDAPFVPGWDCHGLPIELNVEKKHGKAGDKLTPAQFRQLCREYAASQIDIQRDEFKRLGVFGEWDAPYATFQFGYEANIIRALAKIIQNGHLEQGFKPVNWCIACGSSLAEAEVEYENKTSPSIDVAFLADAPQTILEKFGTTLLEKEVVLPIWTTTPWTLPANEAVCLHPEIDYVLLDAGVRYFIVARDLQESVSTRLALEGVTVCGQLPGRALEGLKLRHPFLERCVPVVLGLHVTTDSGTGCVHTAPAHGADDYQTGKAYQLPLINPVLQNGCFAEDVPLLAGVHVLKANDLVLSILRERKALLHLDSIVHSYPHCWRHKTPIIFLATPQWFISMDKNGLRETLLKEIKQVKWIPDWGQARIQLMIESRPDWCISRQRAWGTPIPLLIHKTTRQLHPDTHDLLERVAQAVEEGGIERWFDSSPTDWLGTEASDYEKVNDTLDVWFDSGVSHFCVLSQNEHLHMPSDLVLEGSDQHRGWFNSSITTAVAMFGHAPYREVLTHGYTTDAEGKKLSKSKGNYIALDKLILEHGADIIRLWVCSTEYRHDVTISEEIIKRMADAYRRIRNTARFLLSNLFDFDPMQHLIPVDQLVMLDKLVLLRVQALQEEIVEAYETYQFHVIYQKIYHFCNIDLGSFYLDVIKDRQYTCPKDSLSRRSCQTAMYHILHALTRWLAPVLSFTADEIWSYIPGDQKNSVFLTTWYTGCGVMDSSDLHLWTLYQGVREEVNQALEVARQAGTIGSGLAAEVTLYAKPEVHDILARLGDELRFLLITSAANLEPWEKAPATLSDSSALGLKIQVSVSANTKCERCWHRVEDVGQDEKHPMLCGRCIANVESNG